MLPSGVSAIPCGLLKLAASNAPWKVVLLHEPPYGSSATYGSLSYVQWPYAQWGVDLVLNGHAAVYERVQQGIPYVTNGLGGGHAADEEGGRVQPLPRGQVVAEQHGDLRVVCHGTIVGGGVRVGLVRS